MATVSLIAPPVPDDAAEARDPRATNYCGLHDIETETRRFALPGWLPWLGGRLLVGFGTIFIVSLIVFLATQALPSDPARVILGPDATEESVQTLQRQLGLDRPVIEQYGKWAGRIAIGDFGTSLDSGVSAGSILSERLGNTLALMIAVLGLTIPLAFMIGVALAVRRDSRADRIAMTGLILFKALPSFTVAIALIIIFSTSVLPILPAVSLLDPELSPFAQPLFLILPTVTLVLTVLPFLTRLIRAGMIETLESEFVTAARLRGVPERSVIWRHAVPNALAPVIQGIAMTTRMLLGGALIVEVVFSYPGIGNALNAAIEMRDIPVIQAITLITAVGVVLVNLLADVATVLVTPKLRTAHRPSIRAGTRAKLKLNAGGV
jgi:peptide/nickel transport system permease protein